MRGHHILCLLGFQGLGYSPEFIRNMARVEGHLRANPQLLVKTAVGPDVLCQPCPHLSPRGCGQRGPASEEEMRGRDLRALDALKLAPRQSLPWSQVKERLGRILDTEALAEVCRDCQWLPLGYCPEGVAALRGNLSPQHVSGGSKP